MGDKFREQHEQTDPHEGASEADFDMHEIFDGYSDPSNQAKTDEHNVADTSLPNLNVQDALSSSEHYRPPAHFFLPVRPEELGTEQSREQLRSVMTAAIESAMSRLGHAA